MAMSQIMERSALAYLREWKDRSNRKPLVIRGARQVGKTALVRIFAAREFETYVEINFDETPGKAEFFNFEDLGSILRYIELDAKVKIIPGKTLLFLDEIQAKPSILAKLRYFYEKMPELHIICAGSLLDFALAEPEYSMPVGRIEFLYLGPMGFEEFLLARGQEGLKGFLASFASIPGPSIPLPIHQKLLNLLKEYMKIGGMPGVVKAYIESSLDVSRAWQEQNAILQTFFLDFGKYKKRTNIGLLQDLFVKIPGQLGKTIKYSALNRQVKSREIKECLDLLQKARLIYPVMHSHGNGLPLGAEADTSSFKLLFLDIGLALSLSGLKLEELGQVENFAMVNSGALAEQFIGQHLLYAQPGYAEPHLYYWNRPAKGSTAEVDFLIQKENRVLPVEVKAGATGRLRSLHMFVQEKNVDLALRFNTDLPSILSTSTAIAGKPSKPFTLISLPLYLVESGIRGIAIKTG